MNDTRTHAGSTAELVLGSYRILHELSTGGMGTVYRAQHVLLGRPAAVKLLRRDLTTSPELVQRFVNEARAVTACKHPGIVEVYDFGYTEDGHAFIVMEFLEGESLGRRLARLRLTEIEAAAIAAGIASALKAAHRVGVIHRDLKPDNVFLVPDPDGGLDRTKVLDFGIAKLADGAPSSSQNTQTGALIGTPLYMAPEQARAAAAIDHRADLYSLGCILYHMLVGRPPFVAEGAGEIIALQMFEEAVPPSRLAPISPEMDRLVMRLLEKEPAARFGSAGEVVTALTHLDRRPTSRMTHTEPVGDSLAGLSDSAGLGIDDTAQHFDQTGAVVASRKRARWLWRGTIGAVVAAVAIGVGYAVTSSEEPPVPPPAAPTSRAATTTAPVSTTPASVPAAPAVAPPAPAATAPATGSATATAPPASGAATEVPPPVVAPAAAPPASSAGKPGKPGRPGRSRTKPGVGTITGPVDVRLQDPTLERHRVDPPKSGEHTAGGAPMENSVDLDPKPARRGAPSPSSPPSSPKDPR